MSDQTKKASGPSIRISDTEVDRDALKTIRQTIAEGFASLGANVVSVAEAVKAVAEQVVAARQTFSIEVVTKTASRRVPDWTGRSQEYKTWYSETVPVLASEHIPEEYRARVMSRLGYHVRELVYKTAPLADRRALKIQAPKSEKQKAKQRAKSETEQVPSGLIPAEVLAGMPLTEAVQAAAQITADLLDLIRSTDLDPIGKRDRGKMGTLMVQVAQNAATAHGYLVPDRHGVIVEKQENAKVTA